MVRLVFKNRRPDFMILNRKKLLKTEEVAAILERKGYMMDFLEFLGQIEEYSHC